MKQLGIRDAKSTEPDLEMIEWRNIGFDRQYNERLTKGICADTEIMGIFNRLKNYCEISIKKYLQKHGSLYNKWVRSVLLLCNVTI